MDITNNIKKLAAQIAQKMDEKDGKDNIISADIWKKYAVAEYGAREGGVKIQISVFEAAKNIEYYLKKSAEKENSSQKDIAERWLSSLDNTEIVQAEELVSTEKIEKQKSDNNTHVQNNNIEKPDATRVDNKDVVIISELPTDNSVKETLAKINNNRDSISSKMYAKWSSKYTGSNLDRNFYARLYDVIKTINCSIDDKDFDSANYSSKEEQTMDEVIAVLAGESKLNSKAKNSIYRGIFQLDSDSLTTIKAMAKKYNINGVNQGITLSQFANLPGEKQLDYLIGHVAYGKNRSGISSDEKITPQQLWAMIKKPKFGQKNSALTQQKARAINRVFAGSQIERGGA